MVQPVVCITKRRGQGLALRRFDKPDGSGCHLAPGMAAPFEPFADIPEKFQPLPVGLHRARYYPADRHGMSA